MDRCRGGTFRGAHVPLDIVVARLAQRLVVDLGDPQLHGNAEVCHHGALRVGRDQHEALSAAAAFMLRVVVDLYTRSGQIGDEKVARTVV